MALNEEGVFYFNDAETPAFAEFLKSPEGIAWLGPFSTSNGLLTAPEVDKAKEGLVNKNKEVIADNKRLRDQVSNLENVEVEHNRLVDVFKDYEIGVDDEGGLNYTDIERALGKLKDKSDDDPSKLAETERLLKKTQRDFEAAQKVTKVKDGEIASYVESTDSLTKEIERLLIQGAFKTALLENGYEGLVVDNILHSLRVKSNAQIQKDDETGQFTAIVDDGRSIEDWVVFWKETDEGKALRMTPINTGGGGKGGSTNTSTKPWADMTVDERAALFVKNPDVYRRLKAGETA